MWISRAEYNRLKSFKQKRDEAWLLYDTLKTHFDSLCAELDMHKKEKVRLREQCEEYKQKYADEVNKRLELIKFYEERNT